MSAVEKAALGLAVQALSQSGVTAGTYGSKLFHIQATIDARGRITSVSNVQTAIAVDDGWSYEIQCQAFRQRSYTAFSGYMCVNMTVNSSTFGANYTDQANENGIPVITYFNNIYQDGSSMLEFQTTPAGDRTVLRRNGTLRIGGGNSSGSYVCPASDNVTSSGYPGLRWSVVYAATGTINTSDARLKTAIKAPSQAEIACSIDLADEIGTYQWLEQLEIKGAEKARLHVGMTVQRAIEIFQKHGLDAFKYAFICYDKWDDKYAYRQVLDEKAQPVLDADGNQLPAEKYLEKAAGDMYSLRYEQFNLFLTIGQNYLRKQQAEQIRLLQEKLDILLGGM